jgi:hypothetical protein
MDKTMNKFALTLEESEVFNYLNRLHLDVESRMFVIDRMFDSHKNDTDTSLFDSVPWKAYMSELETTRAEYSMAKDEFSKMIYPIVQEKTKVEDVAFDWNIKDFMQRKVEITLKNCEVSA